MRTRVRVTPMFSEADADLARLTWRTDWGGYARITLHGPVRGADGRRRLIERRAHRVVLARILGRPLTRDDVCDHINRNRLDNRRENIRLTDRSGNAQNRKGRVGAHGLRGVSFVPESGRWRARVYSGGKRHNLGTFGSAEEAGRAAEAARREFGFLSETST